MKHIRKIAAVLIAIALLFAVLVCLGNNGVREVAWTVREIEDLPRTAAEDVLRAADIMATAAAARCCRLMKAVRRSCASIRTGSFP